MFVSALPPSSTFADFGGQGHHVFQELLDFPRPWPGGCPCGIGLSEAQAVELVGGWRVSFRRVPWAAQRRPFVVAGAGELEHDPKLSSSMASLTNRLDKSQFTGKGHSTLYPPYALSATT